MSGPGKSARPQRCSFHRHRCEQHKPRRCAAGREACCPRHRGSSILAQSIASQSSARIPPSPVGWRWPSPKGLSQWALGGPGTSSEVQGIKNQKRVLGLVPSARSAFFSFFCLPAQSSPLPTPNPLSHYSPQILMHLDSHRISHSVEQRSGRGWPFPSFLF